MVLKARIKQIALETGFDLAGVAPISIWKDLGFARKWVENGFGGEMHYLENPKRHDPRLVLPSAQSVLCVGLIYNSPYPYSTEAARISSPKQTVPAQPVEAPVPRTWVSRYAWGQDYHQVMRARLEELRKAIESLAPGVETRVYVDTGPVVERAFARYSGIGWTGKNTCLINPGKGSWFFLGVILTSLEIQPDLPAPDRCGSCTRCLDACPTGALATPYVMDASRCIAYLNIELKGSIPEKYRAQIGSNFYGCDICQDVCPWNNPRHSALGLQPSTAGSRNPQKGFGRAGAATTSLPEFQPMEITLSVSADAGNGDNRRRADLSPRRRFSLFHPPLEALAELGEEDFRRAFARSPVKRPKYRGWLRNLCVVMGNSRDHRFIPKLEELSRNEDSVVREHAEWALAQLGVNRQEVERE
ncbi:MAG TPA: tRNA epoxyqueuosine(34) reductase QueG [Terriglobia bacterium]|nr:tRNA epoxyqueuosine(34) reductase QueG [Terriglobia bacterium]